MKVIHFITSIDQSSGGTTAYLQLLSKGLNDQIDLVIVTGYSANPVELNTVKTRFLDIRVTRWFALKKEIRKLLADEHPDIVHINGIWEPQTWLFQKVAQQMGIKVVLAPHGMLDPYILQRNPLKKKIGLALFQRKAVQLANYLHATSELELSNIRKLGFGQEAAVIPNSINMDEIELNTISPDEYKVKRILFLSRVHSQKGLKILIEAIALLEAKDFELIIAGNGEDTYKEKLKALISQKGLNNKVYLHGAAYGSEKWKLFRSANIFVLPSFSECFGIVVAEALACGVPAITTTGTPWQELETHQCGWWIDLTAENLAKALDEALAKDAAELKEMGERGRKLVAEKYDIKTVANSMAEFYKRISKNNQ